VCFRSFVCSIKDSFVARELATNARTFDLPVVPIIWVSLHKETDGYPEFPGYPYDCMPWSKTPVVSRTHCHSASWTTAFHYIENVGFFPGFPTIIYRPHYKDFGAQYTAYSLASPGFVLPLLGLHAGFTTDLLARL